MHLLHRPAAPSCLSNYQHGRDNWKSVTSEDKQGIRGALEVMQGRRCAYCECAIATDKDRRTNQHIEHFIQKGRVTALTFSWSNLFWSCCAINSCGKFKDEKAATYNDGEIIKPDVDNPEDFFHFHEEGTITIKSTAPCAVKAKETLRVFNLDEEHGRLRSMRRSACAGYKQTGLEMADLLKEYTAGQCLEYVLEELRATRGESFATAIKHTLLPLELHSIVI